MIGYTSKIFSITKVQIWCRLEIPFFSRQLSSKKLISTTIMNMHDPQLIYNHFDENLLLQSWCMHKAAVEHEVLSISPFHCKDDYFSFLETLWSRYGRSWPLSNEKEGGKSNRTRGISIGVVGGIDHTSTVLPPWQLGKIHGSKAVSELCFIHVAHWDELLVAMVVQVGLGASGIGWGASGVSTRREYLCLTRAGFEPGASASKLSEG